MFDITIKTIILNIIKNKIQLDFINWQVISLVDSPANYLSV